MTALAWIVAVVLLALAVRDTRQRIARAEAELHKRTMASDPKAR